MARTKAEKEATEQTPEQLPVNETETEAIAPAEIEPADEPEEKDTTPKGTYATEYFKAQGIPYCSYCGAQIQGDGYGNAVCVEGFDAPICPRLVEE